MPVKQQEERDKGMAKAAAIAVTPDSPRRESPLVRVRAFLGDVRNETRKVSSPARTEVQATTTVVILAVFGFAAFFYIVDTVLGFALQGLLHWLGGA